MKISPLFGLALSIMATTTFAASMPQSTQAHPLTVAHGADRTVQRLAAADGSDRTLQRHKMATANMTS